MQFLSGGGPEPVGIENWLEGISGRRRDAELDLIRRAARFADSAHQGQHRASGEPFVSHALAVATIAHELKLDAEAMAAALLHDVVEDTDVGIDRIREEFGPDIARLVEGVTKMDTIHGFTGASRDRIQETVRTESLRKMLLAMVEDVRVVLVKLVDRLHNMRTLKALPEDKQRRIARETLDIFAPLANRLGVWQLKWELEDLSLRYLDPKDYHDIARRLAEKRVDREKYIDSFIEKLNGELKRADIKAEVYGRPKHIYSIWNKMQRKDLAFDRIFDVRAVRILTDGVGECYAALGIVHTLWSHISGEFDDYIATPKENDYRSIHTAVVGPQGKFVEVQIRTYEMHEHNELGVAAHWRYKEGGKADRSLERKVAWLRQLLEWKDEVADAAEFMESVKSDVFEDRIYVFTPQGEVVDLPAGSTPIDLAYAIHTEVGHRCRGAKVNGRIAPLSYPLRNAEQVEILTVKTGGPSRDWLSTHAGYIKTSRARSRIQRWFKQELAEENIASGRQIVTRELQRVGLASVKLEKLAHTMGYDKVDDMLRLRAEGEIKSARIVGAAQELAGPVVPTKAATEKLRPASTRQRPGGFKIHGVGNLLTHIAACCRPVPGEPIIGFITRGRGVTIHRQDCSNILHQRTDAPHRLVEVQWGTDAGEHYAVDIAVTAYDRHGLLRDITNILADERINVIGVSTNVDKKDHIAHIDLTVEVSGIQTISRILSKLQQVPNVINAERRLQ
ncbi:MAG: GTP pyrophosphokinase [Gammaproteobacteria bacterium]|nr:GTP pyrophosphokinase [Gammaproteobacteria bacterium]